MGPTLACPLSRWRGRIHASEGRRDPRQRRARPGAGPRASVRKSRWRDLSLAGELPAREPAASLARGRAECAERSRLTLARTSSSHVSARRAPRATLPDRGCPAGRGSRGGRERDQSPTAPESRVLPLGQCRMRLSRSGSASGIRTPHARRDGRPGHDAGRGRPSLTNRNTKLNHTWHTAHLTWTWYSVHVLYGTKPRVESAGEPPHARLYASRRGDLKPLLARSPLEFDALATSVGRR